LALVKLSEPAFLSALDTEFNDIGAFFDFNLENMLYDNRRLQLVATV
jgi:hypothetical protein